MCVIIYKAKGVSPLTTKEVAEAWDKNPDGAGLWTLSGVRKSLRLDKFQSYCKAVKKDEEAVYHFRIGTTGSIKKSNCHPFNIGEGYILFHNGCLPFRPTEDITDSEFFGKYILFPALKCWPTTIQDTLNSCREGWGSSSKLCLIKRGKVYISGVFQDYRGLKCSNLYWIPWENKWPSYSGYGSSYGKWGTYDPETRCWTYKGKKEEPKKEDKKEAVKKDSSLPLWPKSTDKKEAIELSKVPVDIPDEDGIVRYDDGTAAYWDGDDYIPLGSGWNYGDGYSF